MLGKIITHAAGLAVGIAGTLYAVTDMDFNPNVIPTTDLSRVEARIDGLEPDFKYVNLNGIRLSDEEIIPSMPATILTYNGFNQNECGPTNAIFCNQNQNYLLIQNSAGILELRPFRFEENITYRVEVVPTVSAGPSTSQPTTPPANQKNNP